MPINFLFLFLNSSRKKLENKKKKLYTILID